MREKQIWDDWVKYNNAGYINEIRDDAPDDVKKAYEEYMKKQSLDVESKRIELKNKHSAVAGCFFRKKSE